ncbi:hypothetical protein LO771_27895 [Streptacidiphilus sp. ASG 303]|uniref:hypothetical protein n=1 Tax=Streptacidiphilus sp. ASG 303 TaxID=2896847 RepID=UPI001E4183A3|nr:hypothetical protein [Streptacidiphilus sp. ASG 303]MCD0486101.1 hypothetical protein [Streptacidiphilus sp. ASG 303]
MTRHRPARTAAAVLIALAACGCSPGAALPPLPPTPSAAAGDGAAAVQRPLPAGRPGTPVAGLPSAADPGDATAVARAAVTADWTWDTALDISPADAQRRSAPWLIPGYAALVAAARPVAAPGADWAALAAHRGWTSVRTRQAFDDPVPDGERSAVRQFLVTVTAHGRDGWRGPASTRVQYALLTRTGPGAPWRVAEMRVAR